MSGSVPPIPPATTPTGTPAVTRERAAPETAVPPQQPTPPSGGNPVDTLETVVRVPLEATVTALPDAVLKLVPGAVLEGIVSPGRDGAPPTLETDFGTLTAVATTPLPTGRVLQLEIQSADVHLVTVPVTLDGKAPTPSFPTVLTLAQVPDADVSPAALADQKQPAPAAITQTIPSPDLGDKNVGAPARQLPQQALPVAIADLPVGARITGTLLPVAAANTFLFVTGEPVLSLTLPHRPGPTGQSAASLTVPNTGTRLEVEIRGTAIHLNARLVQIADTPVANAQTSVILGPPITARHHAKPTQATQRTPKPPLLSGLSIGQTVAATVHASAAPKDAPAPAAPTTTHLPIPPKVDLVLRGYGAPDISAAPKATAWAAKQPITATVIGHDQQGALLVAVADQTLRLGTNAPFPPGTNLTFEVAQADPINPSALTPPAAATTAHMRLESLSQVVEALAASDAAVHGSTVTATLPSATGGAMARLIAYLFAMKSGDARQWLGERASTSLDRIGRGALLGRLGDELRSVERGIGDINSEWRQLPLPFYDGDRLALVTAWLYDGRRGRNDQGGEPDDENETRVIIDLTLSRLGEIRLDVAYRTDRFDMTIFSETPFEDPVRHNMIGIFDDITAISGIAGALAFRTRAGAD